MIAYNNYLPVKNQQKKNAFQDILEVPCKYLVNPNNTWSAQSLSLSTWGELGNKLSVLSMVLLLTKCVTLGKHLTSRGLSFPTSKMGVTILITVFFRRSKKYSHTNRHNTYLLAHTCFYNR